MLPKVSIVLPVRNGGRTLADCLDSLVALEYPKDRIEIIVVDNASSDMTGRIVKKYPVRYFYESRVGIAAARNRGIVESTGAYIASLDADCVADKGWISNLIKAFDDETVGGCGGKVMARCYKGRPAGHAAGCEEDSQLGCMKPGIEGVRIDIDTPFIMGCNSCYSRAALEMCGHYDGDLAYLEDVEIAIRLAMNNYRFRYADDAMVYRSREATRLKLLRKMFIYGFYRPLVFKKYRRILGPFSRRAFGRGLAVLWASRCLQELANTTAFLAGVSAGLVRFANKRVAPSAATGRPLSFFCDDDYALVIDPERGAHGRHMLHGLTAAAWRLLSEGHSPESVTDSLRKVYRDSDGQLLTDIKTVLDSLKREMPISV